jgi:hypothetical protein
MDLCSGILLKLGGDGSRLKVKRYQRRHCTLSRLAGDAAVLRYFKNAGAPVALGFVNMDDVVAISKPGVTVRAAADAGRVLDHDDVCACGRHCRCGWRQVQEQGTA